MKSTFTFFCILVISIKNVFCQLPVRYYTIKDSVGTLSKNTALGFGSNKAFPNNIEFGMVYGYDGKAEAINKVVMAVGVNGLEYEPSIISNGKAFDIVSLKMHPRSSGNIINALFERPPTDNGTELYQLSNYVDNMDDLINSYIISRGADNVFSNSAATASNIERIDLLNKDGIMALDLQRQGFLINERNGNDNLKVALVLKIDNNGNPLEYGPLISIVTTDWGRVGPEINTRVMSRDLEKDSFFRPNANIGKQTISGVFLTLENFKISEGQVFYGFSLFPFDISEKMDLVNLSDFPLDTDGTINGGADLLAGTGFYSSTALEMSGSCIIDINDSNDGILNGSGLDSFEGSPIYLYLVDKKLNLICNKRTVDNKGKFSFLGTLNDRSYQLFVSSENLEVGSEPKQPILPKDWYLTGENINSLNRKGYDIENDGKIDIDLKEASFFEIDFGLNKSKY